MLTCVSFSNIPVEPDRKTLTDTASNVLDVPNFFWDSEPTLHPLYSAVREYLEIKPRIQVLNERCRVFLDLAEILSDSIADRKMSRMYFLSFESDLACHANRADRHLRVGITWIIIILIVVSILVTCSEVFLRFGILSSSKGGKPEDEQSQAALSGFARFSGVLSDL